MNFSVLNFNYLILLATVSATGMSGISKNEFSQLLSSEADRDGQLSGSMTIEEEDNIWNTATIQAWEAAQDGTVSPFVVCATNGKSGYARKQFLSEIFDSSSGSSVAEYPIYNSKKKTCYYVMTTGELAKSAANDNAEYLQVHPLSALSKIRKGTISASSAAANSQSENVKIHVEFGPGLNSKEASQNIISRLKLSASESAKEFISKAFPYSGLEEFTIQNLENPLKLFSTLNVPSDDMYGDSSVALVVETKIVDRADLLAVIAGIASQPEVLSVSVEQQFQLL